MQLIGKKVKHIKFGEGKIVGMQENKMQIDFKTSTRIFLYPDSFESFFTVTDAKAKAYIDGELEEINRVKKMRQEEQNSKNAYDTFVKSLKIKENSHAVFGLLENSRERVLDNWCIYTGTYMTGIRKGMPRVPDSLNMNSACLITCKPEGMKEKDRVIVGIFMASSDFIGSKCTEGIISAHEKYRITWNCDEEDLRFWEYISEDEKKLKWGTGEMKYISNMVIQKVLEDMVNFSSNEEKKEEILDFYHYFNQMNQLTDNI